MVEYAEGSAASLRGPLLHHSCSNGFKTGYSNPAQRPQARCIHMVLAAPSCAHHHRDREDAPSLVTVIARNHSFSFPFRLTASALVSGSIELISRNQ